MTEKVKATLLIMFDVFQGFDRNNNGMLEFDELSCAAEDSSDPTLIISLLSEGDADGKRVH